MKATYSNKERSDEFIKIKHRGKINTPDYLVEEILDQGKYLCGNISQKHVIDNSCGDGQFMIHIVDRYCKDFLMHSTDLNQLKEELETYIHAIDIEVKEIETSKERCDKVVQLYGLNEKINWNFLNTDTLKYNKFDNKMDFVIGNPPYVRVHNLNEELDSVKEYLFGNGGMTNLYIVFYEIGLKMLNDTGILTYITPSSFFTSIAGNNMRNYIIENKLLECLCDLKHFQPFNATTYTTIVTLNKSEKFEKVKYYEFDENTLKPYFVEELNISDYYINNNFYFSKMSKLKLLKNIIYNNNVANVLVKNGYATLADKVFINDFEFESKYIIPIVKASRGKWSKVFYPYDDKANLRANNIPYFQIFILFDKLPYYKKGGKFAKYELITEHNLTKYIKLSEDNPDTFLHTPDKTLLILVNLKEKSLGHIFLTDKDYAEYYSSVIDDIDLMKYSTRIKDTFSNSVILNDYNSFIDKTCHIILGKMK